MNTDIFKKFSQKSVLKAVPLQASLELTYRCNERCTHCYIEDFKDDPKKILSLEQWKKVLKELREGGTLYLILMGGEPTLSPYFFDVAREGQGLGFHVAMISNGLKIREAQYAKKMYQSGLRMVTFSLYSLDPVIHDTMTQVPGSHSRLMKAIQWCHDVGIRVTLNGLLTEANSRGIFELYDWAAEQGYELKVDPNVTPKLNGDKYPTQFRASEETLRWFYRERAKRWRQSVPSPTMEADSAYICNAAKGKCAVNPYGELLPCIEIRESFGNLAHQSFDEIWNSQAAKKWRDPRIADMKDKGEKGLYSFCDHCPGMAKNEHGDPMKLTNYTKLVAKVKRDVYEEFRALDANL